MKLSLSWLSQWIPTLPDDLSHRLTMAGLEVESIETAAPDFSGVVIGKVTDLQPHPNADKLNIATVDIGQNDPLQIVCGAPNIKIGIKVPTAIVGAILPNNFHINASTLRGVESFGMLCSARELGLSEDHAGLMILPNDFSIGEDFRAALKLDDSIITIDLTPNRGDCLSMLGMAREVAAITAQTMHSISAPLLTDTLSDQQKAIHIEHPQDCPLYLGRFITNLNPSALTPLWMSERLRRAGIRSHGILVDITNYVLLELGQPLHAFDANKIKGDIHIRRAQANEKIMLLNQDEITLTPETLLICDEKEPIAVAGVMGAINSACDIQTTAIFLEAAWFNPIIIAGKARQYGLSSDAAHHFERGVDFANTEHALDYATTLLVTLAGGQASVISRKEYLQDLPQRPQITLHFQQVQQLIGIEIAPSTIIELLRHIGDITQIDDQLLKFQVPSYRFDLSIEQDLIEEIARLYGYDNIPALNDHSALSMGLSPETTIPTQHFKEILIARDYQEVITMSFVKPDWQAIIDPNQTALSLQNPISHDLSCMRTTLLPGLIASIDYNFKRQQKRIRVFESGLTFNGSLDQLVQQQYLGAAICGDVHAPQWGISARKVDFFDLKGDLEALIAASGRSEDYRFVSSQHPALHPGRSADILNSKGDVVGFIGAVHPQVRKQLDVSPEIFVFEIQLDVLSQSTKPVFKEIPKFPSARRDLALIVPKQYSVADITTRIKQTKSEILHSVQLFDLYQEEVAQDATMNMAFTLIFQNLNQNLKDSEIDAIIDIILKDLRSINVTLR